MAKYERIVDPRDGDIIIFKDGKEFEKFGSFTLDNMTKSQERLNELLLGKK